MNNNFYESVLPSFGVRILAVFKNGLKKAPEHFYYDSAEDMLDAAQTWDELGKNVYHACATYVAPINRKGDNVKAIKSLWLDLDVGEKKPYASKKEAAAHFEQFRNAVGLPPTWVVDSGNGVHEYVALSKPIAPEQWDRMAGLFAACLDHYGVKHDTSRTQDKASILRVPGTHNYKATTTDVVLKREGTEVPASEIWQKLKAYADANGVLTESQPVKAKDKVKATNKLVGNKEYPPSSGDVIAEHCPVLGEVASSGGDVSYEIWWRAMGVAKHCVGPDEVAVHWTRNRAATGHEKADAPKALTDWNAGPTTCDEFSKHSDKCASCVHNGKGKSPIMLGTPEVPLVADLPSGTEDAPFVPNTDVVWEFGAQWIRDSIAKVTKVGFANGAMTRSAAQDDGTYKHVPFCSRYWQVMRRVRTTGGAWQLEVAYEQYPGQPFKTFMIDSADVTAAEILRSKFSAVELHIYGGKLAMDKMQEVIRYTQDLLYSNQMETPTYPTLGWSTIKPAVRSDLTGEFALGDTLFARHKKPKQILLAPTVTPAIQDAFRTKGTTQEWVRLIDHIYNRQGAEAYQFLIAASFAAPLVSLVPSGGEWHGIPVVLHGDSGAAKTTSCLVAMSIYGYAQNLKFNASISQEGQGDTVNAISLKIGSLRHLPCVLDEMSGVEPPKVAAIIHMIANGMYRDRMTTTGKMMENPYFWDTIAIINSNDKLHEVLEALRSSFSTKATQLRAFELTILEQDLHTTFYGVNKTMVEKNILEDNYGCVGREWIQFLADNRTKISAMLEKMREAYMIDPNDRSNIRFYKDLIVVVKAAAMLAKRRGYIKWDVDAMVKYAERQLLKLRDNINASDWEGTISDFIASLHGRTIVSKYMKTGPGKRSHAPEVPLEYLNTATPPVARKALDDRRFVVTANCLKEWTAHRRIQASIMLTEMQKRGYFDATTPVTTRMLNIGSGTTVSRPQAPCYEFDYSKIVEFEEGDTADMTNVVALPTANQSVTTSVTDSGLEAAETAVST